MECIGWDWNQEKKLAGDHVIKGSALVNKNQRQAKYPKPTVWHFLIYKYLPADSVLQPEHTAFTVQRLHSL